MKLKKYFPRVRIMIIIFMLLALFAVIAANARQERRGAYALAADCPRGAVLYAQFQDLPAIFQQWNSSKLKENYLRSVNFQQFKDRHLALKILERWQEFNDALGIDLDEDFVIENSENHAAIALYDIGRLEFLFVAPVSAARIEAMRLFQSSEFEQTELKDGTIYYSANVNADRGRQRQTIHFAAVHGRFLLATSEQVMLRALANLNGSRKDRLLDEPAFRLLAQDMPQPHFITVWTDQEKLNHDWYFRHYWAMKNADQLQDIRAGIFDAELQQGRWLERRAFLLKGNKGNNAPAGLIPARDAARIAALMPAEMPFYKMAWAGAQPQRYAELLKDTLFEQTEVEVSSRRSQWQEYGNNSFINDYDDRYGYSEDDDNYPSLGSDFNLEITDADYQEDGEGNNKSDYQQFMHASAQRFAELLAASLAPAVPQVATRGASPRAIAGPLFAEINKAAIITLRAPAQLDRVMLENALAELAAGQLMIAGNRAKLAWSNSGSAGRESRELKLPMLGRSICYALREQDLIITNSATLLTAILASKERPAHANFNKGLSEYCVVRFGARKQAFDDIFARLEAADLKEYRKTHPDKSATNQTFFSGNIASLLDSTAAVREIGIKREQKPGRLFEEIEIVIK